MFGLVQVAQQWFGQRIINALEQRVVQGLHRAGTQVVAKAKTLAPVDAGFLRSSIDYQVIGKTLTIRVGAPYGMFQEFGTRYIRPHPYIRPALNEIGRVLGGSIGMEFAVPFINQPILAHQAGFVLPKGLTAKQREHVARHLLPTSKRLYRGNVRRAKLRTRRV